MKWVFLAILLASIWPASSWMRKHPDKLNWLCFLIGFLPFVTGWLHLFAAPISWAEWAGYAKGLEIYAVDAVAIVILVVLRGRLIRPPFVVPMALYFVSSLLATFGAAFPMAAAFYCWQLLRAFAIYLAVANVVAFEFEAVAAILKGLAAGELLECAVAVWQRFGQHVLRTPGTLQSDNELGIASHFVILPFFAIMLGGNRGWLPAIVVLAGLLADALTASRGAVLLALAGLGVVTLFSTFAIFSARKLGIVVSGLAVLAVVAPIAMASFDQRFAQGGNLGLTEDTERLAFKRAAWMMWDDHPGGVGPNNFAVAANMDGYYRRSGAISALGAFSNVHNVYILVLTETGPAGLASYVLMLAMPLVMALRYGAISGRRDPDDPRRDILIGASVTLLIVYIHSTEEWVPIVTSLQYLLAIVFGLVAGLTAEERASKATQRNLLSPSLSARWPQP